MGLGSSCINLGLHSAMQESCTCAPCPRITGSRCLTGKEGMYEDLECGEVERCSLTRRTGSVSRLMATSSSPTAGRIECRFSGRMGRFVRAFGSKGSGDGEFESLTDVCSGADGSIAILDRDARRVQVFDGEGVFLRSFGSEGNGPGQFKYPRAIAAVEGGGIIVSDSFRNDVQIFSQEGELLVTDDIPTRSTFGRIFGGVAVTTDEVMFISSRSQSSGSLLQLTFTITELS